MFFFFLFFFFYVRRGKLRGDLESWKGEVNRLIELKRLHDFIVHRFSQKSNAPWKSIESSYERTKQFQSLFEISSAVEEQ